ncbi:hypothetical protein [Microbacterium sp. H37-C3]|uniref:hypothetical protein n=1 Tax=Microbacterium sp. H37-C3 TaxID=3004354 RepID=UPI0022AF1C9A|nr:hypothetical protein [Microbacterium sp. H37-C3]
MSTWGGCNGGAGSGVVVFALTRGRIVPNNLVSTQDIGTEPAVTFTTGAQNYYQRTLLASTA